MYQRKISAPFKMSKSEDLKHDNTQVQNAFDYVQLIEISF